MKTCEDKQATNGKIFVMFSNLSTMKHANNTNKTLADSHSLLAKPFDYM